MPWVCLSPLAICMSSLLFLLAQVMDPKTATNERVIRDRKPDHTLISFFGDDSYGWFPKGRDIVSFASNYIGKSKQAAAKKVCILPCADSCCCYAMPCHARFVAASFVMLSLTLLQRLRLQQSQHCHCPDVCRHEPAHQVTYHLLSVDT